MIHNVWLIPLIMFSAALINGLGVRKLGKIAGHIAWLSMAACCVISFLILKDVWHLAHEGHWHGETITLWNWFNIDNLFGTARSFNIDMAFYVDQLTAVFLCFVSFIGTLIFIYATGYMKEKHGGHLELDPGYARFFAFFCLFAASMFTLVLGANMAVMFIGWEGVGLCSYLLIGYFFDKPFSENLSCADAGRKAFVMNRIGDAGLIVGMGLLFWGLGTVNFQDLNHVIETGKLASGASIPLGFKYGGLIITVATLAMFLGATGKSAQIPLFTWLPDAMAGPTPVSALIHAATMVTAGVYMVARLNVVFFQAPGTMATIAAIGAITAFAAATMAMTQRGIKKVLAYSTVSQLGYMFLALGVGAMAGGIFHVFTHAFFKGCLFLCAGSVIHAMHHEEDMFKMGGLKKHMPITWITYLIATFCIAGFPFITSGFYSKDEILFSARVAAGTDIPYLWILGAVTALLTAIYMGRSLFLTFHGDDSRIDHHTKEHLHESPSNMTMPLVVLAGLAIVIGFLNVPASMAHKFHLPTIGGPAAFHHFLAPVVDRGAELVAANQYHFHADHAAGETVSGPMIVGMAKAPVLGEAEEALETQLALMSGALAIVGLLIAFFMFRGITPMARKLSNVLRPLWSMSYNTWWWDATYNKLFKDGAMRFADGVWQADMGLVDGLVNGAGRVCRRIGEQLRALQSGRVQVYGLVMLVGVCVFIVYFALGMNNFLSQAWTREDVEPKATHVTPVNPAKHAAVTITDGLPEVASVQD